jgi:hypothetical protein
MFFSFMMALISIGGGVLIIMIIMRGINRSQEIKQQTYMKTLEKGVYDYRLLGDRPSTGTATLGWGIFFASIGVALFISFIALGILGEAIAGSLVPLFMGIGLIVYWAIRKQAVGDEQQNDKPVTFAPPSGGAPVKIAGEDE